MSTKERIVGRGMWGTWQKAVEMNADVFCAPPLYVDQLSAPLAEYRRVSEEIQKDGPIDPSGTTRDCQFGAIARDTCFGKATRMWLDSNVEYGFLERNLPSPLGFCRCIEVGAGYGRLAASIGDRFESYDCVDAVPISTELSRQYLGWFQPDVRVWNLDEFLSADTEYRLAVNIHSWSECDLPSIEAWLEVLAERGVQWLFTVSNGGYPEFGHKTLPYTCYRAENVSFVPAIEKYFKRVIEENIGLNRHPHTLWRRK